MTLFLVVSEIRGGVFKVYAKKGQQQNLRRKSGGLTSVRSNLAKDRIIDLSPHTLPFVPLGSINE